ncbi:MULTISPECIES: TrmB family transcriptional regulator [Shouchella]|uniref:Helix-turn-helix domain-containing protein n=2 Tax=Shouchella TaxID=2893057 RepID=A0ABY7WAI8_9BACI|nr:MULTISPECIES: TrmB family transcriptional regulator [Shouchella]MED4127692.1 helix-turn-helix domain-containing protein [Shouchella miscanthi]WDF05933.1 helix-turn-helix domain-containing protein [Shouchella hunanensis]GAF20770.1 transcriptional regulator, TrmB family [Bacillus sp. JCM 19047]
MLQQFGFTQYESQVYTSLITVNQPLDATAIVKRSGVPRSKVYEVITKLIEKGVVLEAFVEKKRQYTGLPMEALIEKLTANFEANIEELKKIEVEEIEVDDRVWTLREDQSILSIMKELMEGAKQSIHLSLWADEMKAFLPLLEEVYHSGREVHLHAIGTIQTVIPTMSVLIPTHGHDSLERSRILIVDEKEMVFAGIEEHGWQAIRTQSKPLVTFFTEFFYHDVVLTKITQRYHELIMTDDEVKDMLLKLKY